MTRRNSEVEYRKVKNTLVASALFRGSAPPAFAVHQGLLQRSALTVGLGRINRLAGCFIMSRPSMQKGELAQSQANLKKLTELHGLLDSLLSQVLIRGFHGEVTVKLSLQDGTIQLIEEGIERKHR
jgi:hypothetical protein